jgi:sec-independent protein translocase protein TatA
MSPSIWQILIIVAVILLLFGGRKIPQLMKDMGSGITSFRKGLKEGAEEEKAAAPAKPAEPPVIEGEKTTASAAPAKPDEAKKA